MTGLFEEGLFAFLTALVPVREIVNGKIFPARAPDKAATPFLVYAIVSNVRDALHDRNPGFVRTRVQFSCWSDSYSQAKRLALELVKATHGYRGAMGQVPDVSGLVEDEADRWDTESRLYHVVVDVHFWHSEET